MSKYYTCEAILEKKKFDGDIKYLVKWVGYPHSQNTWEPIDNFQQCMHLIYEFEKNYKKREPKSPDKAISNEFSSIKRKFPKRLHTKNGSNSNEFKKDNQAPKSDSADSESGESEKNKNSVGFSDFVNINCKKNSDLPHKAADFVTNSIPQTPEVIDLSDDEKASITPLFTDKPCKIKETNKIKSFKFDSVLVEFKPRADGKKPDDIWVRYDEIKKSLPHLVIEYFEKNFLKN